MRTVVVDAGHGGAEDGARGPEGTLEKNVTLSVARRLKAALEARLGVRVILTRDGDVTMALDERAALANNNKADLFVSLHANASVRPATSGAEVFYLSLDEYGDAAQRVAHGESESLPVFGGGTRDIEVILWEMAQARYIQESAALAQAVEASLRERVPISPRAIQQAPFRVLVGANMPAVLVEMGFLTNPEQEKQLQSDEFQNAVVQGLVESITRFRDAGSRRGRQGRRADGSPRGRRASPLSSSPGLPSGGASSSPSSRGGTAHAVRRRLRRRRRRQPGAEDHGHALLRLRGRLVARRHRTRRPGRRFHRRAGAAHRRGAARAASCPACVGDTGRHDAEIRCS